MCPIRICQSDKNVLMYESYVCLSAPANTLSTSVSSLQGKEHLLVVWNNANAHQPSTHYFDIAYNVSILAFWNDCGVNLDKIRRHPRVKGKYEVRIGQRGCHAGGIVDLTWEEGLTLWIHHALEEANAVGTRKNITHFI